MADLGAVGKLPYDDLAGDHYSPLPLDQDPLSFIYGINHLVAPRTVAGVISGTITVDGSPQENVEVFIFNRRAMVLIARVLTDANGDYSYTGVNEYDEHVVLVKAPSQDFNEQVARPAPTVTP